ncbi:MULTISPECIES: TssN family type VI secretion system protein [Bacteroidaceae]|uniref:TssN family type VI secretion system protein n=1 Tax=Bacteroidaceae TaxID=815 RepID=UPI0015E779B5|nr:MULTISPECIES: TssN family type VI secretion system protein [Bacteroidaceae]MCE8488536.1 TssN family type VI secretion system protein [Bacteroides thetaiotaomicron]
MNPVTQHLISSYLLMPLLTVIFGVAAYFIARKNRLLNNKKLIVYLLLCGIVLALPGLSGFMDYNFMPYIYILLVVLYWTAGHYNRRILLKVFSSSNGAPSFGMQCLLTVTAMLVGAGLFSVVFNLCNELEYGIWASTCILPFVFPLLYTQTVKSYFDIPVEIYKVWKYSEEYDSETLYINRERSIVIDVDIFRRVDDPVSERITGKASDDVIFGQWFQRMIDDCNLKSPSSPIVYQNEGGAYYEWVFYTKSSFFRKRFYIDPECTLAENKLKMHDVIIAKRVANELVKHREY